MSTKVRASVIFVRSSEVVEAPKESLTSDDVGSKAFGLLSLPLEWTPPFFCIEDGVTPNIKDLLRAASLAGIGEHDPLYVRSSGTKEGIDERGSLCSEEARLADVPGVLASLRKAAPLVEAAKSQKVHFLVQRRVRTQAKGHLSNERRIAKNARDWIAEIEPSLGNSAESGAVAYRRWRTGVDTGEALNCHLRANIYRVLRQVAAWAGNERLHLEWVWDGEKIWIVQCEPAESLTGASPHDLAKKYRVPSVDLDKLQCFRKASNEDFSLYGKLKNASIYLDLGYSMPTFYVLNDPVVLDAVLSSGTLSANLESDLQVLCSAPLVLRTDGTKIPEEKRQMLPRSDELRSVEEAKSWLLEVLTKKLSGIDVIDAGLVLIGHHFLPAVSSAWCLAYPDRRRVRIESLWGIPEGLYYYAHDVFDVDVASLGFGRAPPDHVRIVGERTRYKDKFIAPDPGGNWVIHTLGHPNDWNSSIPRKSWVLEIAHTSRLIAANAQKPVVVMWFIGLVDRDEKDQVLPWYHEPWTAVQEDSVPSDISKSKKSRDIRTIRTSTDLETLIAKGLTASTRIAVEPEETGIVRDQDFIERLSSVAKQNGYVVELRGGLLSHVYYTLKRNGVEVVCIDAYALEDETLEFNKLVRDSIPGKIEAHGESAEVAKLEGEALLIALKNKLVEEALEVADARSTEAICEEIADVLEVLRALEETLGLTASEIEEIRSSKRSKRGGFSEGVMLLKTHLSTPTSGQLVSQSERPVLRDELDLPPFEHGVNVDKRIQRSDSERLLTFSVPIYTNKEFKLQRNAFDLNTPLGESHPMMVEASIKRTGAEYRVRFRLENAPLQLGLGLKTDDPSDGDRD